jgi:hypothetical protein
MKSKIILIILTFAFLNLQQSYANLYLGLGGSYNMPYKNLENFNESAAGARLELLNKEYCNLWYGVKLDYFSLERKEQVFPYFENTLLIQPEIKYAPFVSDCYDNKLVPYIQANLTMSSISGTDDQSKFGLGYGLGAGVCYNFKLFNKCFMLDLDGLYSLPNNIYKPENRMKIETINVGLTLSVNL